MGRLINVKTLGIIRYRNPVSDSSTGIRYRNPVPESGTGIRYCVSSFALINPLIRPDEGLINVKTFKIMVSGHVSLGGLINVKGRGAPPLLT